MAQLHNQARRERLFGGIVGGYAMLWFIGGFLTLSFGLINRSAMGLGGLAALLALVIIGPLILVVATLLLISAIGLWQGRRWARPLVAGLAILHLLGGLFFISNQVWQLGLGGLALSAATLGYLFSTRPQGSA
ncbi:MAG: hypothetical protein SNJ69_14250 [Chloroflexaceae bacterium]